MSEVLAYLELAHPSFDPEQRLEFLYVMSKMDAKYLELTRPDDKPQG